MAGPVRVVCLGLLMVFASACLPLAPQATSPLSASSSTPAATFTKMATATLESTPTPSPATMISEPTATIAPATPTPIADPLPRLAQDRPDEVKGNLIHLMYILSSDGVDRSLDTNGTLAISVAAFQYWLSGQTGGRQLRFDTYHGALDITFFQLDRTDSDMQSLHAYVRDEIERQIIAAGFDARGQKIYAVYYDGTSDYACGGGAWPPDLPGIVAALYLNGLPASAAPCAGNPLGASATQPGYWEFSMLHEILHTLGMVAICAPHQTLRGHVADTPKDLMYAGPLGWEPSLLDAGNDD